LRRPFSLAGLLACASCAASGEPLPTLAASTPAEPPAFTLHYEEQDAGTAAQLEPVLEAGVATVEAFFGLRFDESFTVRIFADRAGLDGHAGHAAVPRRQAGTS